MMAKDNVSPLGSLEDISNACNELMKFNIDEKVNKTLHLVLKRKWWEMIDSGEKTEEYRDVNHYWAIRLLDRQYRWYSQNFDYPNDFIDWLCFRLKHNDIAFRSYENVCFHLGYTNNTMTFKITSMNVMYGEVCRQDWGAEPNKYYFAIKLGERVEQ